MAKRAAEKVRRNWMPVVVVALVAAECAIAPFALIAFTRTTQQSEAGAKARTTQVKLAPITCRVYLRLEARGIITPPELAQYLAVTPFRCPPAN